MTHGIEVSLDPLESENLSVKREELRNLIHLYTSSLEGFEFISDVAIGFKREHPECYDYILFHDLIGSTPPPYVKKFDMPNNEIEHLIEDLPKIYKESRRKIA